MKTETILSEKTISTKKKNGKSNLIWMTKIAILSAISTIVMLFEFPLPFAPSFYELDMSEAVILIGGFALGPLAGVFIELIKILLNFLINGTITFGIGELANFIMGCSLVLPAALIYKHKKSLKSAIIGMAVGTVSLTVVGSLLNLFVLLPMYAAIFGMPMSAIVKMGSSLNHFITDVPALILYAVMPFNLLKGIVCSLIAGLLYKRVSPILHK